MRSRSRPLLTDVGARSVRLIDVGHSYGASKVLGALTLELRAERVGLIGVNGAGKSTLMRVLTTALEPTSGSLTMTGLGRTRRECLANVGYMPQELRLPGSLRVVDFLAHVAWVKAIPRRARGLEIDRVIAAVGLEHRARSRVAQLSGGMLRRLLLAQALLDQPPVLILDEPTAGLDPEQRIRFRELIAALDAELVVVSSHALEDLVPIVRRILMLDGGRIVFDGTTGQLAALGAASPIAGMSDYEAAFLRLRMESGGPLT